MPQVGFIRDKQEIKYLILFIAERLIYPVRIEVLQELTMCDPAIDFFDFSECVGYLVESGHLTCSDAGYYEITRKGVQNGRACVEEIPYSVRLHAEELTAACNKRLKRQRQVQSKLITRYDGTFRVLLSFNDELGRSLWKMELVVPKKKMAKDLIQRFESEPEKMYSELIHLLYPSEKKEDAEP